MLDERSLLSQFVRFSTATVASLMVFSLYSIVDGLFVARGVGEYAMSAVNLSAPFLNLLFSIAVIFAVGTSTILSIFLGQGKRERANSLFSQNVTLLTVTGIVITVLVFLFLEPVAKLLGAEGVTLPYTKDYLTGLAPFAVCFIISSGVLPWRPACPSCSPVSSTYTTLSGARPPSTSSAFGWIGASTAASSPSASPTG